MGRLCLKAGLESEGFLSSEADKWKPDHPARGTDGTFHLRKAPQKHGPWLALSFLCFILPFEDDFLCIVVLIHGIFRV